MLVDVTSLGVTGKDAEHLLDEIGITVNKNQIPFDQQPPNTSSGIRVGTPAVTSRGMGADEMREIAHAHRRRDRAAATTPAAQAALAAGSRRSAAGSRCPACPVTDAAGVAPRPPGVTFIRERRRPSSRSCSSPSSPRRSSRSLLTPARPADRDPLRRGRPAGRSAGSTSGPCRAAAASRSRSSFVRRHARRSSCSTRVVGFVTVPTHDRPPELVGAARSAASLATAFGVVDDYLDLRARWQFARPARAGRCSRSRCGITRRLHREPVRAGASIRVRRAGRGRRSRVLWIVGMINSINFIDGLDGLSSGIGLIAAVTLGADQPDDRRSRQPFVAVLCFVLAGALLGFLRWNFHPATIFAGTSGVMFLGYTLAVLSILGTAKVAVAMLVLGVPIIDAFWIIVRRLAAAPLAVHARPRPPPPPAARRRPVAPPDRPADLRDLRRARGCSRCSCPARPSSTRSSACSSRAGSCCSSSPAAGSRRRARVERRPGRAGAPTPAGRGRSRRRATFGSAGRLGLR